MVKSIKEYFQCGQCGTIYKTKSLAGKCEAFCRKHRACNQEIVKHAIKH